MKRKFIYIAVAFAFLAAAFAYYEYNRPVKGIEGEKPEASMNAAALLTEFESDETTANKKYFDKVIEVNGIVSKIGDVEGKSSIYLNTGSDLSFVICELEKNNEIASVKIGDSIVMKGKCTGYLSDVILVQSVIKN